MIHRPLPQDGELIADARVIEAYDKGADKGALIYTKNDRPDDNGR
ncbi:MAG: hypothetical protein CM1200mP20_12210 [Pseudomonadota bacterium]|nr:MAG: hypothetical protein CM1200mP20_12210 [Pseudomonadota bacterium]